MDVTNELTRDADADRHCLGTRAFACQADLCGMLVSLLSGSQRLPVRLMEAIVK